MKSKLALAFVLFMATAAQAGTVTLKGDDVIKAISSKKDIKLISRGADSQLSTSQIEEMINGQLRAASGKVRASCIQNDKEVNEKCSLIIPLPAVMTPDGGPTQKASTVTYKFTMAGGKVTSDLTMDQK